MLLVISVKDEHIYCYIMFPTKILEKKNYGKMSMFYASFVTQTYILNERKNYH